MRTDSKVFSRWMASIELLLAAAFWGFGFVATVWALRVFGPMQLTFTRFLIAGLLALFFLARVEWRRAFRANLKVTLVPAVLLAATLILQTWGLMYTTATKSGFITTLYVIFVPVMDWLFRGRRLPLSLWACVVMALIGTGLIVNIGISDLNVGDLLTLACALAAAAQIQVLGELSKNVERPFVFNIVQAGWAALLTFPLVFLEAPKLELFRPGEWPPTVLVGVLSLAFGSTVLAFYLQVRAQAKISTTLSSLLFVLESPFALIFASLLLGERLGLTESSGAFLIFLSAVLASVIEGRSKK